MIIPVIDTETTGLDPTCNSVVEFAAVLLEFRADFVDVGDNNTIVSKWHIKGTHHSLVKPRHPISVEAMAIHHIMEKHVADAPPLDKVLNDAPKVDVVPCFAAHNAAFDSSFLPMLAPFICTFRLAKHIWPDAPSYSNQVLRYWLTDINAALYKGNAGRKIMGAPPHRALPDAWVTAHILQRMLLTHTVEQLMDLSSKPILLKKVSFGKHYGKLWAEVPKDYLRWMMGEDFDADTLYTVQHYL